MPAQQASEEQHEASLPYFHGALMDQDVDGLLKTEGDYLLQVKPYGKDKTRLYLAVRGPKTTRRFELRKSDAGQFKLKEKSFETIERLASYFQHEPLEKELMLKRAIPRGKFQMRHADVRILKKIGSGAYGTVYRGLMRQKEQQTIAIKKIDSDEEDDQALADMMKEARVMQLYDHRNIVRFHGFIVESKPYLLIMEYCDGGSVEDRFRQWEKKIPIVMRIDWSAQAAAGLEYLHSKECIHRDLAARNCLLDRGVVKLADFGMCRPTVVYKVDVRKPMNVRWLAPEVWRIGETRFNTDIYAFGVMLWEMFEVPYKTPYDGWKAIQVKKKTQEGYRMSAPELMPDAVVDIMEKAWHHEPNKRPDARKLRKMLDEAAKTTGKSN